jgi:hypothetical protein
MWPACKMPGPAQDMARGSAVETTGHAGGLEALAARGGGSSLPHAELTGAARRRARWPQVWIPEEDENQ